MSHHKHKRTHQSTLIRDIHSSNQPLKTTQPYENSEHPRSRAWICGRFLPLSLCSTIRFLKNLKRSV